MSTRGRVAVGLLGFAVLLSVAFMARRDNTAPAPVTLASVQPAAKGAQAPTTPLLPALVPFNGNACYTGPVPTPGRHTTITVADCAPPPPTSCPPGRYVSGSISLSYGPSPRMTDLTSAAAVFGRLIVTDPITPMPWAQGAHPTIIAFPRNGYVAFEFTVPTNALPNQRGTIYHAETVPGPHLDAYISPNCGDFTPNAQCGRLAAGPGQAMVAWKVAGGAGNGCPLNLGVRYFINVKPSNPAAPHFECGTNGTGPTCKVSLMNNHTP